MVECIARAAKELLFVSVLILLFAYIYAIFGVTAFDYDTIDPDLDDPMNFPKSFNTVLDALKCMWQIFTNDHWLAVLFDARQVKTWDGTGFGEATGRYIRGRQYHFDKKMLLFQFVPPLLSHSENE